MQIEQLIKACADGIKDRTMIVVQPEEWKEIINFQAGELFPEIGYRGNVSIAVSSISQYQIDLSGETYVNLEDIKEVYLEDKKGKKILYENWVFNKEISILDLDPKSSREYDDDPASFENVIIVYQGYMGTIAKDTADIDLTPPKMALLKKICIKEAIRRILLDHAKLDRYRTLVGRTNEYALLAMIRDLTTEIEISKRRLVDTHQVKTF